MDLHQYNQLSNDHKLAVWDGLLNNPGFQVLQELVTQGLAYSPAVESMDGREKLYYEAVLLKGKLELMAEPADRMRSLRAVIQQS